MNAQQHMVADDGTPIPMYVSREQVGTCHGCGKRRDLRNGFCFQCAKKAEEAARSRDEVKP